MDRIKKFFIAFLKITKTTFLYLWLMPFVIYHAATKDNKDFKNTIIKKSKSIKRKHAKIMNEDMGGGENVVVNLHKEKKQ